MKKISLPSFITTLDYPFAGIWIKKVKVGQTVAIYVPISSTHDMRITATVMSRRKVKRYE